MHSSKNAEISPKTPQIQPENTTSDHRRPVPFPTRAAPSSPTPPFIPIERSPLRPPGPLLARLGGRYHLDGRDLENGHPRRHDTARRTDGQTELGAGGTGSF